MQKNAITSCTASQSGKVLCSSAGLLLGVLVFRTMDKNKIWCAVFMKYYFCMYSPISYASVYRRAFQTMNCTCNKEPSSEMYIPIYWQLMWAISCLATGFSWCLVSWMYRLPSLWQSTFIVLDNSWQCNLVQWRGICFIDIHLYVPLPIF